MVFLVRAKAGEVDTVVAGPADDRLVEKHGAVVEIVIPCGISVTEALSPARMWVRALLRTVRVNTHPMCTSVKFRVWANSPLSVGPQWATVSPSKNPGSASTSSPALRTLIELRSSGEGFVVDTPDIWSLAFAVFR